METLEHTAKIMYLAMGLGNVNVISKRNVERLLDIRDKMKISGRINTSYSED